MMHREILSEEFFSEFYADTFSDCLSDIYTSVSEVLIVFQNIVLIQMMWLLDQQKDKKP